MHQGPRVAGDQRSLYQRLRERFHWMPKPLRRFSKFGIVGALGVVVNLLFYTLFKEAFEIEDFLSRALAIELSILHNFSWSMLWVWGDRGQGWTIVPRRLLKYHATTLFSSFGVTLAVGWAVLQGLPEDTFLSSYISHLAGIAAGMLTNFLLANFWVFKISYRGEDRDERPIP
ncbi:hypothetical protein GF324_05790 [bacterium]|nr:hypothetical protein [bacterium]